MSVVAVTAPPIKIFQFVTSRQVNTVLALTVKIRFLASISGSPGDQIFSHSFRNSISVFLNSHLWRKTAIPVTGTTEITKITKITMVITEITIKVWSGGDVGCGGVGRFE